MMPENIATKNLNEVGVFPASPNIEVIAANFYFDWNRAEKAARALGQNLDQFLCLPLLSRLHSKGLKSPVSFWYTPLGDIFVISVCSPKKVDFFDPLHDLPGYLEYGGDFLRPSARPILHWDGNHAARLHPIKNQVNSEFLLADFGSVFGLTVSECDEATYAEMQNNPTENFAYSVVPRSSPVSAIISHKTYNLAHVLCISNW